MLKYFIAFISVFFLMSSIAQEMPEDKVDWDFSIQQKGCDVTLIAKLKIVEHWHINATKLPEDNFGIPTTFKVLESDKYDIVGGIIEPKPHKEFDEIAGETLSYHEGSITLKQKLKVQSDKDFKLEFLFGYQPCDSVKCIMPFEDEFSVNVSGCSPSSKTENNQTNTDEETLDEGPTEDSNTVSEEVRDADTSIVKSGSMDGEDPEAYADEVKDKVEEKGSGSLWWLFFAAMGWGFLALLTPCVFPMIPMTVSFFTKTSKTKAAGVRNAIIYSISIIAIFVGLATAIVSIFGEDALNALSTHPVFNIIIFLMILVFAISFLGAFEIRLPNSWANKVDKQADRGGIIGIFFMALALVIISFSCTGPFVGTLLFESVNKGGMGPVVGMFGFSLALALPFGLFAAFPGWMNSLPQSGGWLNTVKVVLGFLELAFAFKFLSNADLSLQAHLLERELFLAIWIGIFVVLAIYLFGLIRMPHDSPLEKLSVGRALLGTSTVIFVLYMLPGLWGAPLKIISAFPPPPNYSESPYGVGGSAPVTVSSAQSSEYVKGTVLGPQNIMVFHEYDEALAHAKKVNKPLFVDFTGHNCVNCRKMEQSVWSEPGIIDYLRDSVVIVSLHVDERKALPKEEQKTVTYPNGRQVKLRTTGQKWSFKQVSEYKITAQPYYVLQNTNGEDLDNGSADYQNHSNPKMFKAWLEKGMTDFNKRD